MKTIKIIIYIVLLSFSNFNFVYADDFNSWLISFKNYALKTLFSFLSFTNQIINFEGNINERNGEMV